MRFWVPFAIAVARPNILLLFPDEWRFDWDGLHEQPNELKLPNLAKFVKNGTRFNHAYVPSPLCAPSRSSMAAAREYDYAGVLDNLSNDYPINQTTFYTQLQLAGYYTMMTGKDDLNKATQLGYKVGKYLPNGAYHMKQMGISGGIRHSGKEDVIDIYPIAHEAYGFFLQNHTVSLENGTAISAWAAHYACFNQDRSLCDVSSYPDELYEDNFVAANALALLDAKPQGVPWFLQVSFPGPHPPFITTASMAQSTENRTWPQPTDSPVVDRCTNSRYIDI